MHGYYDRMNRWPWAAGGRSRFLVGLHWAAKALVAIVLVMGIVRRMGLSRGPALVGGLFLVGKSVKEIHEKIAHADAADAGLANGQGRRAGPIHLSCAGAEKHLVFAEHDGVALDVFADQPGEFQVG